MVITNIKVVKVSGVSLEMSQYLKETVVITDGSDSSLLEASKVLNLFCDTSGMKINFDKSHLFLRGPLPNSCPAYLYRFLFDVNAESVKSLVST